VLTVLPLGALNSTIAVDDYASTIATSPLSGNVKNNDYDPQGNTQTITAQTINQAGKYDFTLKSDGSYTFTAVAGFTGTVDLPYTTCDDVAPTACATATLHIVVNPFPTVLTPDVNAGLVNTTIPGNLSTNDVVPSGTTYGPATSGASNPSSDKPTVNSDGSYTFTTTTPGVYSFDIPVCVPGAVTPCPTTSLSITVTDPALGNNPPIAKTDIATTAYNTAITVAVKNNDGAGNAGGTLAILPTISGNPTHGTAVVNSDGTITYTPNTGYSGTDKLTYQVCETPSGKCATADLVLTILPSGAMNSTIALDDYASTIATSPLSGNVKNNDYDPQGNTQTITAQTINQAGKYDFILATDGSYTFTATAGFTGTVDLPYTTCDDGAPAACATATLHIVVNPSIVVPITETGTINAIGGTVILNVTSNDKVNGVQATLGASGNSTISTIGSWPTGISLNTSTGAISIANGTAPDSYSVTYQLCDKLTSITCATVTDYITVVVTPIIANPDIADGINGKTGNTNVINALDNDKLNGNPVVLTDVNLSVTTTATPINGGAVPVLDPTTGIVSTPAGTPAGVYTITYSICEKLNPTNCNSTTISVTVDPATILATADAVTGINGKTGNTNVINALDNDKLNGNPVVLTDVNLSVTTTATPINAGAVPVLDTATGIVSTPAGTPAGVYIITYSICEKLNPTNYSSATISVTVANNSPIVSDPTNPAFDATTKNYNITTPEDTPISGAVKATDVDGDVLAYAKGTDPAHGTVTVNNDGTYTYNPAANYNGDDSFTVTVSDGKGGSTTTTIFVIVTPVNDPPVVSDPTNPAFDATTKNYNITTPEDTHISGAVKATDVDGDVLAYAKGTDPAHGTVTVNNDGTYTYNPAANYNGDDSFTVTVSDGKGGSTTTTIFVIVTPVNDPPVVSDPTNPAFDTTTKNYNITTPEDTPISGAVKATDVDGDVLAYAKGTDPVHGTVTVNNDGTYTYNPAANYNGDDSFTVTVSDGKGGSTTTTIFVIVTPVNDVPVAVNDNSMVNRDAVLNGNVSTNDVPSGDGGNVWTKTTDPIHGSLIFNVDGTYTYTPVANFSGTDNFTYTITDANGDKSTATVDIIIAQIIGDAPLANSDNLSVNENSTANGNAAANDIPSTDGGNVWSMVTNPTHGTATMNQNGIYTYTPNTNFSGHDYFTYSITDINGDKSISTINITVIPVNDNPIATALPVTTPENKSVNGTVTATDSNGDPLTFTKTTNPTNGKVTVNADGTYTYTPNTDYVGSDIFTVTVSDGKGGTNTVTVNVTITAVALNKAPIAIDDNYTTVENKALIGNVLSNDSDPDGNPLTLTSYTINGVRKKPGTYTNILNAGTIAIVSDGSFTFTPEVNYNGTLPAMKYTVSDGNLTDSAKAIIQVLPLPKITKKANKPVLIDNSTYTWTYTITVNNDTDQKIDSIQVIDNLDDVFKKSGCTYSVTSIKASGSLWSNGLYNGSSKIETLIKDSSYLNSNSKDSILIEVKVDSHNYVGEVFNQAILNGQISKTKFNFSDILSDDLSISGTKDSTVTSISEIKLFIPNAFSPNGDTKNQTFVIRHPNTLKLDIEVFNRWGNQVYKSSDYQNDWDGKGTDSFLGKDLPAGTYYCIYKAINTSTGKTENEGIKYITLRR